MSETLPTCTPASSTLARGLRPPTFDGVQAQFIGAAKDAGALAELDQQHGQQHQSDEHEQADFGFQIAIFP